MKYLQKLKNSKLTKNIISLFILQGSNYLFPLLTMPYLIRVLGLDNYGLMLLSISIMMFLNVIVDYGFNISATREISLYKHDIQKIEEIYNQVINTKIVITVLIGSLYFLVITFIPYFSDTKTVFFLSFFILIGNSLFPIWLYHGLEKMAYVTYINVAVKTFVTIVIFIFINSSEDLEKAVLFQSLYYLIPGIISIILIKYEFNITFKIKFRISTIFKELNRGKFVFMTNMWINFYKQGPIILLGFIIGTGASGNFGVGQKIQGAFSGLASPVSQAVYPVLCELYENNLEKFYLFKKRFLWVGTIFSFTLSFLLFLFASEIGFLVVGKMNEDVTILIRYFAVIVFFSILNTVFSRVLFAMDLSKELNKSYLFAAIIFLIIAIPLTYTLQEVGMAISVIISEGIVLLRNFNKVFRS